MRRVFPAALILTVLLADPVMAVTIGPARTKRDRSAFGAATSSARSVRYESVMRPFLAGEYAEAEKQASLYLSRHSKESDADEAAYIRALCLMKLDRFDEARTILDGLRRDSASVQVRSKAAYSLGDSYYFRNDRSQAEAIYREAISAYPQAGEAYTVRRILGLHGDRSRVLGQFGVEESGHAAAPANSIVQVGAFSSERNAQRQLNKLLRNGYDARLVTADQVPKYHVQVSPSGSRADVDALVKRLKKDGYPTKVLG